MNKVKIIADSLHPNGKIRLTTFELRYWRGIHAEVMTHRVFSRNAGSSRAKPVKKVLEQVWNDPAGPIHWGVNQPGMQAKKELGGWKKKAAQSLWKFSGRLMCIMAWCMMKIGLHKQVANRILEPWQYIDVVLSSTEWDNFWELRCHEDAQPEFQSLARQMRSIYQQSVPTQLGYTEWHLPYIRPQDWIEAQEWVTPYRGTLDVLKMVSTARVARVSYTPFDGNGSFGREIDRHDKLVGSRPIHASPTEHIARPLCETTKGNFSSFMQYREEVENRIK